MKSLFRVVRYSVVGVFLAGIFTTIVGCSNEDQLRALILFLLLLLTGGGGMEEAVTGPTFTFSAGPALSFNQSFGENTTACTDGGGNNFQGTDLTLTDSDAAGVDVTINAFRYCKTLVDTDVIQVVVFAGPSPDLTLLARTETMEITTADCAAGGMCIVHFDPGLAVSATDFVGFYTPPSSGQMGVRASALAGTQSLDFFGDPSGTNTFGTSAIRRLWDFGTQ